jgi:hypothetical protein
MARRRLHDAIEARAVHDDSGRPFDHMLETAVAQSRALRGDTEGALRVVRSISVNAHRNLVTIAQCLVAKANEPGLHRIMSLAASHLGAASRLVALIVRSRPRGVEQLAAVRELSCPEASPSL